MLQPHAVCFDVISAMAKIAIPGMAVTYRALPSCVSCASTDLSKHGVCPQHIQCVIVGVGDVVRGLCLVVLSKLSDVRDQLRLQHGRQRRRRQPVCERVNSDS